MNLKKGEGEGYGFAIFKKIIFNDKLLTIRDQRALTSFLFLYLVQNIKLLVRILVYGNFLY